MWPFKKEPKSDRTCEAIACAWLKTCSDIGETFNHLGRAFIVAGRRSARLAELPALRNQQEFNNPVNPTNKSESCK